MTREIKFRYVYKCNACDKIIIKVFTLEQIEGVALGFEPVGSIQCSCDEFGRNFAELVDRVQYTGLKDKAGVEIYEGDIIKMFGSFVHKVIWCHGGLGYFPDKYSGFVPLVANQHLAIDTEGNILHDKVEVIGNVYESPELMEGKE